MVSAYAIQQQLSRVVKSEWTRRDLRQLTSFPCAFHGSAIFKVVCKERAGPRRKGGAVANLGRNCVPFEDKVPVAGIKLLVLGSL